MANGKTNPPVKRLTMKEVVALDPVEISKRSSAQLRRDVTVLQDVLKKRAKRAGDTELPGLQSFSPKSVRNIRQQDLVSHLRQLQGTVQNKTSSITGFQQVVKEMGERVQALEGPKSVEGMPPERASRYSYLRIPSDVENPFEDEEFSKHFWRIYDALKEDEDTRGLFTQKGRSDIVQSFIMENAGKRWRKQDYIDAAKELRRQLDEESGIEKTFEEVAKNVDDTGAIDGGKLFNI